MKGKTERLQVGIRKLCEELKLSGGHRKLPVGEGNRPDSGSKYGLTPECFVRGAALKDWPGQIAHQTGFSLPQEFIPDVERPCEEAHDFPI